MPSMTFAASAKPVVYTLQAEGTHVVAAMSVDLFGRCADYDEILPRLT